MMTSPDSSKIAVQPYLFFNGRCEEAVNFYRKALGAEVEMISRFKEAPDQSMCAPGAGEKIMHTSFRIGETTVMASDGQCTGAMVFQGFALSINLKNEAEASRLFAALADGGKVQMPMTKTFFSPAFGMVVDQFGVSWMIHVQGSAPASV